MATKNSKIKLVFLMIVRFAFLGVLIGFYFIEVQPKLSKYDDWKDLETQRDVVEQMASALLKDQKKEKPSTVVKPQKTEEDLLREAMASADPGERNRKEGSMWIDIKASKYIATFGLANGVRSGSYLTVYAKKKKVGRVIVEKALDVISFVIPADKSSNFSANTYYKVIKE